MGFSEVEVSSAPATFRERLAALRAECGATQQDLADFLEVPLELVREWESGVFPKHEDLVRIAEAFDTTVDYLILATKQRMPPPAAPDREAI
jgi:transcriptional regulator with XRE-family HTH domain